MASRLMDGLRGEFLVHHFAHPLTAAFDGDGERAAAAFGQDPTQLRGHSGGPHRADADAGAIETILIQPVQEIGELGMLGDGGPQQAEAFGGFQAFLHSRDQAVIQRRCPERQRQVAGQTEPAQFRTTAHHLHHVDVGPGGLGGDHR